MNKNKKLYRYNDKSYTMDELCQINKLSKNQIRYRLKKGLSIDEIINHKYHDNRYKHGMKGTKLYQVWKDMKRRCYNPRCDDYENYHNRGISICEEWLNDNTTFFKWAVNNGYKEGLSIDRIDNNKGYSPSNCSWTTVTAQNNNRQNSIRLLYHNNWLSIREIADMEDISYKTAYKRYVIRKKTRLPRKRLYDKGGYNESI